MVMVAATSGLGATVTVDPSATAVCSIAGNVVSFLFTGTCTLNANQAGDANYTAAPQIQQSFGVGLASQTVSVSSAAPTGAVVGGATYVPTATATSGLTVTLTVDLSSAAICTLSGGTVSYQGAGTCLLNADQAGDDNFNAAPRVTQSFGVGQGTQVISFSSTVPAGAQVGVGSYTVVAASTSGLSVSLSIPVGSAGVCSISGSVVSFLGAGSCVVEANQVGNINYAAATMASQNFAVGRGPQTIVFSSSPPGGAQVSGSSYAPTGTATSGLDVAFTVDGGSSSVCSISGGIVSFQSVGPCVINANQAGDANFLAASQVQQSFSVGKGVQELVFSTAVPTSAAVGGATYTPNSTSNRGLSPVIISVDASSMSFCSISGGVVR
jgi:hypothetical protein